MGSELVKISFSKFIISATDRSFSNPADNLKDPIRDCHSLVSLKYSAVCQKVNPSGSMVR